MKLLIVDVSTIVRQRIARLAGDPRLRDTIGELANTLAGNARRHFGENLEISVPLTAAGALPLAGARDRPYVVIVNWKTYSASLVVDLERTA